MKVLRGAAGAEKGLIGDSSVSAEQVHLSVVEIYNESINDLLSNGHATNSLAVQQDNELGITFAGATKVSFLSNGLLRIAFPLSLYLGIAWM